MSNKIKELYHKYFLDAKPERLIFNSICGIETLVVLIIVILEYCMEYESNGMLALIVLLIYLIGMLVLGNLYPKKLSLFSALIMVPVNFLVFPFMFLFTEGGGLKSGMPIWFTLGLLLPFLTTRGAYFAVLFPLTMVTDLGVMLYAYRNQDSMLEIGNELYYYQDNLVAIIGVACSVGAVIYYQRRMQERQTQRIEADMLAIEQERNNAQRANQAKTSFLANMSHDIRTPLNAIVGMADIAQYHSKDPAKVEECLDMIHASSVQLLHLVNNILDLSEIETSELKLRENHFQIEEMLGELQLVLAHSARSKKIDLQLQMQQIKNRNLIGDSTRLRQVFLNLIGNSIKYTQSGGWVQVRVVQTDNKLDGYAYFTFEIEDNGIGMSQEFIDHQLYRAFEREEKGYVRRTEGNGIGMSITKSILDAMGAQIQIRSKQGEGTCVRISIRLCVDQSVEDKITTQKDGTPYLDASGKKILVVEDNDINMEIIKAILQRTQADVAMAWNAEEALDMLLQSESNEYDLVLMDIQLPGMDGYGAARSIRGMDREDLTEIPILAMTANAFSQDVERALSCGMNAHIAKPIDVDELFQKLAYYLFRENSMQE